MHPTAPPQRKASPRLAFLLGMLLALGGCAQLPGAPESPAPPGFRTLVLPGRDGATLQALERGARVAPLRYRVVVVPGSGCAGMGAFAGRYFAGLLHAQVLVLHKPGVDPQARTAPGDCASGFVQQDRLSAWLGHARAALQADALRRQGEPPVPQLLVGISEGAELLPALAPEVPQLAGLVLIGSSGLDPQQAGALQAERLGAQDGWAALGRIQAGRRADGAVVQGRSLGYWRDLWTWPLALPLVRSPWPLLQVWGGDDALVPAAAYAHFAHLAARRTVPYCARRIGGADHGLQRPDGSDGVQQVWAWVEQWARAPQAGLCGPGVSAADAS